MTFSRTLTFACALFCLSAPAELYASADASVPATASFAYRRTHPVTALPESTIESVARAEGEAEQRSEKPVAPPPAVGVAPARSLSRDSVCDVVVSAARAHDLPVPFFANLIWQESNFKTTAISPAGAQGIAQFMPRTAAELGLLNPFEPVQALFTAGKLLRQLVAQFGNLGLAAAAYNAGPKRVADWLRKRSGLPGETRNYVRRITGRPADKWTSKAYAGGSQAALMPARAPCTAVAAEVDAQVKAANAGKLMADLTATASLRAEPTSTAATTRPALKRLAAGMARSLVLRVRGREAAEAAKQRTAKAASRVLAPVAGRTVKNGTVRLAKANTAEKARKSAPTRRARYASAR